MHIPALLQFLQDLSENNNRPWFMRNKPAYDILREEFLEVIIALIPMMAKFDPEIEHISPKKAIFRINRDIRFSNNKDPYKTNFSASISNNAKKGTGAGYYFQINKHGTLFIGGGYYAPEPPHLKRIRTYVAEEPAKLKKLLSHKAFKARFGGMDDEGRLTRPPKGFTDLPSDFPHMETIKQRHFVSFLEISLDKNTALEPTQLATDIAATLNNIYPLVAWLREALRSETASDPQ